MATTCGLAGIRSRDPNLLRHAENGDVGEISIRVIATDGGGESVSVDFTLTVDNVNDPPEPNGTIAAQVASEDTAFSLTLPANTFIDVDAGDTMTYAASLTNHDPLPAWLTFDPATRTFSGTPDNDDVGEVTIRLFAIDEDRTVGFIDFTLTVQNVNDAPTVVARSRRSRRRRTGPSATPCRPTRSRMPMPATRSAIRQSSPTATPCRAGWCSIRRRGPFPERRRRAMRAASPCA
jgi:hypothetical protein